MTEVPEFGTELRRRRTERGMSLAALSTLVHYSKGYLSKVENGAKPPSTELAAICDRELDAGGALIAMVPNEIRPSAAEPEARPAPRPAQLPPVPADFVGRAGDLAALDECLAGVLGHGRPVVATVDGMAGVGKTALAVHWANRVREHFPDGALFVDLRGYDRSADPAAPTEVLAGFLSALGVPAADLPAEPQLRANLFRSLVDGRRMLIVLDNAASSEQVRQLLPGSGASLTLVTSRNRLSGLATRDGARRITLGPLVAAEAGELLRRTTRMSTVDASAEELDQLAQLCGRLPLALRIAAERAVVEQYPALADLVEELAGSGDRLGELSTGHGEDDDSVVLASVFSWSYRALPAPVARMFRLLGLHPGPEISVPAAAALAGVDRAVARRLVEQLCGVHLLQHIRPDRYRFHDLVREYAAGRAAADEDEPQRAAATRRVLVYYLRAAETAGLLVFPYRFLRLRGADDAVPELVLDGRDEAMAWYERELPNLLAATRYAAERGEPLIAWQLPIVLSSYLYLRNRRSEWIGGLEFGLAAARRSQDRVGVVHSLGGLGHACYNMRRYSEAYTQFDRAITTGDELGEPYSVARHRIALGKTCVHLGRYSEGREQFHRALEFFQHADNKRLQATVLNSMGFLHRKQGRFEEAACQVRHALRIWRELDDPPGEGQALHTLGDVHLDSGRLDEAIRCFQQSHQVRREVGDRRGESKTLDRLATALHRMGREGTAQDYWRAAVDILDDLDPVIADEVRFRMRHPESVLVNAAPESGVTAS